MEPAKIYTRCISHNLAPDSILGTHLFTWTLLGKITFNDIEDQPRRPPFAANNPVKKPGRGGQLQTDLVAASLAIYLCYNIAHFVR